MAEYIIDDGGDNTDGTTWAKAYNSLGDFQVANGTPGVTDILYFGHNSVDTFAYAANILYQPATTQQLIRMISVTQGTGVIGGAAFVKQIATANQIDLHQAGAFGFECEQGWHFEGIRLVAGGNITFQAESNDIQVLEDCTVLPGPNGIVSLLPLNSCTTRVKNLTIDCTNDTGASGNYPLNASAYTEVLGLTFVNCNNRTGGMIRNTFDTSPSDISGIDISAITTAAAAELISWSSASRFMRLSHIKVPATWTLYSGASTSMRTGCQLYVSHVDNDPTFLVHKDYYGEMWADTAIVRTGGAEVEGTAVSWGGPTSGLETQSYLSNALALNFYSPWIHFNVATTGAKTLTAYIVNDLAAMTDAEVWLEAETMATASDSIYTFATSRIAGSTDAATTLTSDSSTWTGSGPAYTHKQKITLAVTVNVVGIQRARFAVGRASLVASSFFFMDPQIEVT